MDAAKTHTGNSKETRVKAPWQGRNLGEHGEALLPTEDANGTRLTSGALRQPFPPRSTYQLVKGNCRPTLSSARQQPKSEITSQGQPSAKEQAEVSHPFSSFFPLRTSQVPMRATKTWVSGLTGTAGVQTSKAWVELAHPRQNRRATPGTWRCLQEVKAARRSGARL